MPNKTAVSCKFVFGINFDIGVKSIRNMGVLWLLLGEIQPISFGNLISKLEKMLSRWRIECIIVCLSGTKIYPNTSKFNNKNRASDHFKSLKCSVFQGFSDIPSNSFNFRRFYLLNSANFIYLWRNKLESIAYVSNLIETL